MKEVHGIDISESGPPWRKCLTPRRPESSLISVGRRLRLVLRSEERPTETPSPPFVFLRSHPAWPRHCAARSQEATIEAWPTCTDAMC